MLRPDFSTDGGITHNFDLFRHPELLSDVANLILDLQNQSRIVACFEHAKSQLRSPLLGSNDLNKCAAFIQALNDGTDKDNFYMEVSKLNLEELAFSSISFSERQLKMVRRCFKASDVEAYVRSQRVSCIERQEIFKRLNFYCKEGGAFQKLYASARQAAKSTDANSSNRLPSASTIPQKRRLQSPRIGAQVFGQITNDVASSTTSNLGSKGLTESCKNDSVSLSKQAPVRQRVNYTIAYAYKSELSKFVSPAFFRKMEHLATWGTSYTTACVRAHYLEDAIDFEIDWEADDIDGSEVFRDESWGTVEMRRVNQLYIRASKHRGQPLVESLFYPRE